jgi:hypothetical protein
MDRKFQFSDKQWHNLILTTLIQNPLIILCKHKPAPGEYQRGQYLPYEKWDYCLHLYEEFLSTHHIAYWPYDYMWGDQSIKLFLEIATEYSHDMDWWTPMWKKGIGCIGSPHPKVLLVAERIGPNNMNNIPFETGPTGQMLTELLVKTGTPLGLFAVTNFVKSFRRDDRPPNEDDYSLLGTELDHLKPQHVIFMGSVSKAGAKEATVRGIPYTLLPHFGAYSHRGDTTVDKYIPEWRRIVGITPTQAL